HHEVVLGDHRLRRERDDLLTQVDGRPDAVDEGGDEREPGRERARVAAQALDDGGAGLRDDTDRSRQRDDDDQGDDDDDDHGNHAGFQLLSLLVNQGGGALDLHDLDLGPDVEGLVG